MYHTLVILLHRPFMSDGHLQNIVGSNATAAFSLCIQAADGIDEVLRLYEQHFCFKACPYALSYATYVSGTIHVRVAAQSPKGSRAHLALSHCLSILEEQQALCHAPRHSMMILMGLVRLLEVDLGRNYNVETSRSEVTSSSHMNLEPAALLVNARHLQDQANGNDQPLDLDFGSGEIEIDAVIQSFNREPLSSQPVDPRSRDKMTPLPNNDLEREIWNDIDMQQSSINDGLSPGVMIPFDPIFGIDALSSDPACMSEYIDT